MSKILTSERKHFHQVITTFQNYARHSVSRPCSGLVIQEPNADFQISTNNRRRRDIFRLPRTDQELLESLGYKKKIDDVDRAILANAQFITQIVENPEIFGHDLGEDVMETEMQANEDQAGENPAGWCTPILMKNAYDHQRQFSGPSPLAFAQS